MATSTVRVAVAKREPSRNNKGRSQKRGRPLRMVSFRLVVRSLRLLVELFDENFNRFDQLLVFALRHAFGIVDD